MVNVKKDLTGWSMWEHGVPDSKLTVICQTDDYVRPDGRREAMWKCKCNCGSDKEVIASGTSLKSGNIKSCGCINIENITKIGKRNGKLNVYDYTNDYGVGFCSNTGEKFYFDWEDFDKIKDYCWFKHVSYGGYISIRAHVRGSNKQIKMYKLLTGFDLCDHKNRNTFDNRKSNLRESTHQQNARNHSVRKDNTSGITGVWFSNAKNKWVAQINIEKGHKVVLGYFKDKTDAIVKRLEAELQYYGEFAPQKNLFKEYNIKDYEDYER